MRVVHLSDLHITSGPRLADHKATLDAVINAAIDTEPDLWLLTGDLWGRTVPHVSTTGERAVLYPALVRMADTAPVVVVVGNHDSAADLEALVHLGGRFSITVIATGGRHRIDTRSGVAHVYGLPYPSRAWLLIDSDATGEEARAATEEALSRLLTAWGSMIRARRATHPEEVHILAAHGEVEGVGIGDGEVVATGEIRIPRLALDLLPVDYGALGHIHTRQEAAHRCFYAGSLWHTEHADAHPERGWNFVGLGADSHPDVKPRACCEGASYFPVHDRASLEVWFMPSPFRPFVTLRYAWTASGWAERPASLDACRGAEVRAVLTVTEAAASSCPWPAELAKIRAAGAERVQVDRRTIPVERVRAPMVASAETPAGKLRAWWGSLDVQPAPEVQAAALDLLDHHDNA